MQLNEYQSKRQLARYGIPIPEGYLAHTPDAVFEIAERINTPVIVKAQVLAAGRDKAGGIRLAYTPEEARQHAEDILGMTIASLTVDHVLVEAAIAFRQEIYLGISVDRDAGKPVLLVTAQADNGVKKAVRSNPQIVMREMIDPFLGIRTHQITAAVSGINLPHQHWRTFADIATRLYHCFTKSDATSVELIPLIITEDSQLMALDAKLYVDTNALFRQPLFQHEVVPDDAQRIAQEVGVNYVPLAGDVACIANGAASAMVLMDMLDERYGISASAFIDICNRLDEDTLTDALSIALTNPNTKAILLHLFGARVPCNIIAESLLKAFQHLTLDTPIVVYFQGIGSNTARYTIAEAKVLNLRIASTLAEAVQKTQQVLREVQHDYSG